ncbi:lipid A biosynthesis lauroyl acyltransferase [Hydrogenimonas urashimensis]|uniref:lipid A biosynthesis lauroyl acyltransferase n=1 Tax=Hydrogenimonas urashimensis TaxID=2740515 RepID=UPI00191646E8|nr:lipid A biosynthesis lauroyl acyltransferase [Hydrogenimonas urashimensis]
MKDFAYVTLYRLFRLFVLYTPKSVRFPVVRSMARFAYILDRRHRRIAYVNLDIAFDDTLPAEEKKRIVKRTYENLLFLIHDFVLNQSIGKTDLLEKVKIVDRHYIDEAASRDKPLIFITAHYGNWEIAPLVSAALYGPITIVGRPLDSRKMNEILKRGRERFDVELVEKRGAMRRLITALRNGRNVGLLVDQNTTRDEGIEVQFFGKTVRHTPAAALLARRLDLAVVPIFVRSDDHEHYTIKVYPPIEPVKTENAEEDIKRHVQAQADVTERAIREKPDEWFWLHKRWRSHYNTLYEKGPAR